MLSMRCLSKVATVYYCVALFFLALACPAWAVRPFVTDDARVVGDHQAQLETSVRYDKDIFTNLNLFAFGPTARSEVTLGWQDGFPQSDRKFSLTGPLMQFKYLMWEAKPNAYPGLALVIGALPPWGVAGFRTTNWSEFVYAAMTESLFENERVLIHANIGMSTTNPASVATWGVGTQIRLYGGLNAVLETFYNDPYFGNTGGAYQVGFRYIVSDSVQVDATMGSGLFGGHQINTFVGMGLRMVSDKLF
jgi:hypothetical protein